MDEWIRWALGIGGGLISIIVSLVLWEIRRVGKNVHKLRTDVSSIVLGIESQVRAAQVQIANIQGQQEEARAWRELVMELIAGRVRS
jgi:hypothetical protein